MSKFENRVAERWTFGKPASGSMEFMEIAVCRVLDHAHDAGSGIVLVLLLAVFLAGCGGGGGSDGRPSGMQSGTQPGAGNPGGGTPPEPPFGLVSRASVAPLAIPLSGGVIGSYDLEEAFPSLTFPAAVLLVAVPGENRLVVIEQSGVVRAFTDSDTAASTRAVLDLSGRVVFAGEQGLLGLAFDPDFVTNRFIYVHYILSGPRRSRIARFTWDAGADQVALASEKIILEVLQPYSNHNGGMLAFGPDGYLYISFGDGGDGGDPQDHAQNPGDMLGSLVRIDVHPANPSDPYDIPIDNPFLGQAGILPETYAFGLRNPWRFSFDRGMGTLWLGDVGQGSREEIDIIRAGGNYGWRVYEGDLPFNNPLNLPASDFDGPVIDYGRSDARAIIGGYVYRGSRIPSLQGRYVHGDNSTGNIWALSYDAGSGSVLDNELIANAAGVTSFGEDTSGDVHVVTGGGTIYQFREITSGGTGRPTAATLPDRCFSISDNADTGQRVHRI